MTPGRLRFRSAARAGRLTGATAGEGAMSRRACLLGVGLILVMLAATFCLGGLPPKPDPFVTARRVSPSPSLLDRLRAWLGW